MVNGEISVLDEDTNTSKIEITELPIRVWTQVCRLMTPGGAIVDIEYIVTLLLTLLLTW